MKRKKNDKQKQDEEQQLTKGERKVKKFISKAALEIMDDNPDVVRMMVGKTFDLDIPTLEKSSLSKLAARIDELVLEAMGNDSVLRKDMVDARIAQIMESLGVVKVGEEWRRKPMTMDKWIEEFKKVNELKDVLGIKPKGFLQELASPEVLTSILKMITEVFGNNQPTTPGDIKVLVMVDGKHQAITIDEYNKLESEGRVQVTANMEPERPNNPGNGSDEVNQVPDDEKDEVKEEESDCE